MNKRKIYFRNLNGLRFIAAFLVIIHHAEQLKSILGIANYWGGVVPFISVIGKLGVVLFFVLSGFLITYLLLEEEHSFKTINIKNFYIRRILRIWPLYFLIIILAFFILPNISLFTLPGFGKDYIYTNLFAKLFLFAIFCPNVVIYTLGVIPYASHTWSIGTEEQYYLVWPIILRYFKKHRLFLMLFIVVLYLFIAKVLGSRYIDSSYRDTIKGIWSSFNIDCMAIGGFFSVLLFQKNKALTYLNNEYLFYAVIIATVILMIKGAIIPYVHYEFYAVLFGIIILNFASNNNIKISLENKVFNYLGNISYGLYMYHPIGIILALFFVSKINIYSNWLIYPLSILLTMTLAALSYKYYETFFLKFKVRFSKIISGNETTEQNTRV